MSDQEHSEEFRIDNVENVWLQVITIGATTYERWGASAWFYRIGASTEPVTPAKEERLEKAYQAWLFTLRAKLALLP